MFRARRFAYTIILTPSNVWVDLPTRATHRTIVTQTDGLQNSRYAVMYYRKSLRRQFLPKRMPVIPLRLLYY